MHNPRSVPAPRLPGLDAARAAAILWVILYHAMTFGLVPTSNVLARTGWAGVDLFFVLSGYLIGGQLMRGLARDGGIDWRGFYGKRAGRILPAYLAVVALYLVLTNGREYPAIAPWWQFATFTVNLFGAAPRTAFSHVWSLCVEEHFYLLAPVAIWLLARRPSLGRALAAGLALLALGIAIRAGLWFTEIAPALADRAAADRLYMSHIYYPTWTRLDGLLAGVTLAAVEVFRPGWWAALTRRGDALLVGGAAVTAAALLLFGDRLSFAATVFGYPLLAFGLALGVAGAASPSSVLGRGALPGAAWLAGLSYSLYLSHKLALYAVQTHFAQTPAPLALALHAAAVLLAGWALHAAVERPFLRLRDRLIDTASTAGRPALAFPPDGAEAFGRTGG